MAAITALLAQVMAQAVVVERLRSVQMELELPAVMVVQERHRLSLAQA
jgi:hypothetical protein